MRWGRVGGCGWAALMGRSFEPPRVASRFTHVHAAYKHTALPKVINKTVFNVRHSWNQQRCSEPVDSRQFAPHASR